LLAYTKVLENVLGDPGKSQNFLKVREWEPCLQHNKPACYCVQITTLVNAKEKPIHSERTLTALVRVGQAVNLAVERFVAVGEAIARDNPEIQREICDACRDARTAGICCVILYVVGGLVNY